MVNQKVFVWKLIVEGDDRLTREVGLCSLHVGFEVNNVDHDILDDFEGYTEDEIDKRFGAGY